MQTKYYLLWKGLESGPYTVAEIQRMLKFGEIGVLHKIRNEHTSEYILLKDFNFSIEEYQKPVSENASFALECIIYTIIGASFLSIWIFLVAFVLMLGLWFMKYKSLVKIGLPLLIIVGPLGAVFFKLIYPMLAQ